MNVLSRIGHFFLSEWIWSITWGIYHIPITIFLMAILFKRTLKMTPIKATLLSGFASLSSFAIISVFTVGVLIWAIGLEFIPSADHYEQCAHCLTASLSLGVYYTILQAGLFWLLARWYPLRVPVLIALSLCANLCSSWLVYFLLPATY